jgi:hypothetical protein
LGNGKLNIQIFIFILFYFDTNKGQPLLQKRTETTSQPGPDSLKRNQTKEEKKKKK